MMKPILPTSIEKTLISYIKKTVENNSLSVYIPPWYDILNIEGTLEKNKLIDYSIDSRYLLFRFSRNDLEKLVKNLISMARKGNILLMYPELLLESYRGVNALLNGLIAALRNGNVIMINRQTYFHKYLLDRGYSPFEISEFGMEQTYIYGTKIDKFLLNISEGNIAVQYILGKYGLDDELLKNYILDYYSFLEAGQRKLLLYLATRTFAKNISTLFGSETYVFIKRLIDKGHVLRLGGKANYLIRDPLLRIELFKESGGKNIYRVAGWLYLFIKLLLSINRVYKLETDLGRLYIGSPIKFKWIEDSYIRILGRDNRTYSIIFNDGNDSPEYVLKRFQYEKDIKILLSPYEYDAKSRINIKRRRVHLITPIILDKLVKELRFPRKL